VVADKRQRKSARDKGAPSGPVPPK
jgi:hypothetical protein